MKTRTIIMSVLFFGITTFVNSQTLTDGLISYYKLDETSGAVIDEQGVNDGTTYGSPTTGIPGILNTGYDFDNVNDYIDLGNNFDFSTGYSIAFWANIDGTLDDGIISREIGVICNLRNGDLEFCQNVDVRATITNISLNQWIHLVFTWDQTTCKIYKNGVLEASGNYAVAPTSTTSPVIVGNWNAQTAMSYDGSLDEIGIWSRALTQDEVSQLWNSGSGYDPNDASGYSAWKNSEYGIYYDEGNVGIGRIEPAYGKLQITQSNDDSNGGLTIASSDLANTVRLFHDGTHARLNGISGLVLNQDGGNVGIGTTNPTKTLDVNGDINFAGDIYQNGQLKTNIWSGDNSTAYYDGSIGIGTTSPSEKLDSRGDISFGTNGNQKIRQVTGEIAGEDFHLINEQGTTWQRLSLVDGSAGTAGFKFQTTANSGTDWSDLMIIKYDGNVGIGTTNPTKKLDVSGDVNFAGDIYQSGQLKTFLWSGDNLTAYYDGSIGIGTTSPTKKLDVNGDINFAGDIYQNGQLKTIVWSGDNLTAYYGGLIGIGTINPTKTLDVNGDINFDGDIYQNGQLKTILWSGDNSTAVFNGNVGIGTTDPGVYKLAVEGKLGAHEVVVTIDGWSDFVFENNYELMSLKELENFIKENKHLPEIPPADEVEENGISVGEMNAKLLQKIEELTLYIIEQDKKIEAQNKRIQQLENK